MNSQDLFRKHTYTKSEEKTTRHRWMDAELNHIQTSWWFLFCQNQMNSTKFNSFRWHSTVLQWNLLINNNPLVLVDHIYKYMYSAVLCRVILFHQPILSASSFPVFTAIILVLFNSYPNISYISVFQQFWLLPWSLHLLLLICYK